MPLTEKEERWYIERTQETDPSETIIKIDEKSRLVTYSTDLRSDESNTKSINPEELVHALTIALLTSKQYKYKISSLYHEKYYPHGSTGSLSDEIDILIEDDDGLPYALWELKSSDEYYKNEAKAIQYQLFGTAPLVGSVKLLVYATIKPKRKSAKLELKCIDYTKYKSYESWVDAGNPTSSVFPTDYQDIDYKPYINGSAPDLKLDCTQSEFRSVAVSFHNEFFGEHPDNAIYINLVKCLLAKIHDERTTKKRNAYRFQVFHKNNKPQSAKDIFIEINTLYKEAYNRYIDPTAKEPDEIDPKEFSPDKVKSVVQELQNMSITKGAALHGDIIGAFFEEILRVGFKQDKGMYFTHSNIVRFIIEALDISELTRGTWESAIHPENRLPYIIDPACGSGTFLLQSMKAITGYIKSNKDDLVDDFEAKQFYQARLSDEQPNYWAENFIYGFDPKFIMAITAKVNMVLHGDGSAHMFKEDAFKPFSVYKDPKLRPMGYSQRSISKASYPFEMCETFDVVLSNPPFGITLSNETKRTLSKTFSLPKSMPSEAIFIERCFQLLKPNGRIGIVLPESIFNASDLLPARKFIYRMFEVKAIVSLPRNVFIDTPTLTSLFFARKKTGAEISAWDKEWSKHEEEARTKVKKAKGLLSKKKRSDFSDKSVLQTAIFAELHPMIGEDDWALKKGINSEVLTFSLPNKISNVDETADYYKALLSTASIERYIDRYVFQNTVVTQNYSYSAFVVDEVGFKLSKRKEKARPNQLIGFKGKKTGEIIRNLHLCEEEHSVVTNKKHPMNVLDHIRVSVRW